METSYRRALLSALWRDVEDLPASNATADLPLDRTGAQLIAMKGPSGDVMVCCMLLQAGDITIDDRLAAALRLSPTQARVACLLAARRTNREIADYLGLSQSTIRGHTEAVFMKLGVTSRWDVEAVIARALLDRT